MSNKRKAAMLEERELQIEARTNQWKGYIDKESKSMRYVKRQTLWTNGPCMVNGNSSLHIQDM